MCVLYHSLSRNKLIPQRIIEKINPSNPTHKIPSFSKIDPIKTKANNTSAIFRQISANAPGFLNALKSIHEV